MATPELMIRVQHAALTSGVRRGCAALSEAQGQIFRVVRGQRADAAHARAIPFGDRATSGIRAGSIFAQVAAS